MICKMSTNFWIGDGYSSIRDSVAFVVTNPARAPASSCQYGSAVSPVPKCEGPGAHSSRSGKGTGSGPTRQIASR